MSFTRWFAAPMLALLTACQATGGGSESNPPAPTTAPDTYVVASLGPSSAGAVDGFVKVTCKSTTHPDRTKTMVWDGIDRPGPVVGDEWLCNVTSADAEMQRTQKGGAGA